MKWYQVIENWFKSLFSKHNQKAIGKVLLDAGEVVADASSGNYVGAATVAVQIPADASNIKVTADASRVNVSPEAYVTSLSNRIAQTQTTTASPSTTFVVIPSELEKK